MGQIDIRSRFYLRSCILKHEYLREYSCKGIVQRRWACRYESTYTLVDQIGINIATILVICEA